MAFIVERNARFYVVMYDGIDPITRRQRRHWHAAGNSRVDAEAIAARVAIDRTRTRAAAGSRLTLAQFLCDQSMPRRRRELRPSTATRYAWMIEN